MKKILVPIDFKEASKNAINVAIDICSKSGDTITLLHMLNVKESFLINESSTNDIPDDVFLLEITKKKFESFIEELSIPENVTISTLIKKEKDMADLGELTSELNIELIVMGTEGMNQIENWFFETNTQKTVRHSEIPVLSVRTDQKLLFKEVVFISDFNVEGIEAFIKLARVIDKMNLKVIPLYVVTPNTEKNMDTILESFNFFKNRVSQEVEIKWESLQIEVCRSTIEDAISNYIKRNKSTLISLSTHGLTGLNHLLLGSITRNLVNDIDASVLTVKM